MGIAAATSDLGAVIYPVVFQQLQSKIRFGQTVRAMTHIMLFTFAMPLSVMRNTIPPKPMRQLFDPKLFTLPLFTLATLEYVCVTLGVWEPTFYIDLWAIENNIASPSTVLAILSALNAASIFGRMAPNYLADVLGPMNVGVMCNFITAAILFCWLAVSSPAGTIIYAIFYGFFSRGLVSLLSPVTASIAPDPSRIGACMGTAFSIISIGTLIGNPIVGTILRSRGSWTAFQAT